METTKTHADPFAANADVETKPTRKRRVTQALETQPSFAGYDMSTVKTISEVAPELTVYSASDLKDEPFLLHEWRFAEGDYGKYAVMLIERQTGERALLTCGGVVVMQKLQSLHDSPLPILCRLEQVGGGKGKNPTWLLV